MRIVFVVALASCLAWSVGEYATVDAGITPISLATRHNQPWEVELSRDNGNISTAWCYFNGADTFVGDQYDTPPVYHHLEAIKYYVWSQGWPDSTYQGFSVACWRLFSGVPTDIIWPYDQVPVYNPNTGGNWIINTIHWSVDLSLLAPDGFLVGIGFLYSYPACDGLGVDNTGPGPYDWSYAGWSWQTAPYGKGSVRALLNSWGPAPPGWGEGVEPSTLGNVRALYR